MGAWRADARARADRGGSGRGGFSLAEVLVALLILEVGLLAGMGLLRLAAHEMRLARRAEAAQWAAAALADSLVAGAVGNAGEREEAWGRLRWSPVEGGVRIEALRPEAPEREPLARVWIARSAGEGAP